MTDLCWTCQQNSSALTCAVNTPLAEKSAALSSYMEHLEAAHKERSFYKTVCDQCRMTIHSHFQQGPASSHHHHCLLALLPTLWTYRVITLLTMHNRYMYLCIGQSIVHCVTIQYKVVCLYLRYTILVTLYNQAPFTS